MNFVKYMLLPLLIGPTALNAEPLHAEVTQMLERHLPSATELKLRGCELSLRYEEPVYDDLLFENQPGWHVFTQRIDLRLLDFQSFRVFGSPSSRYGIFIDRVMSSEQLVDSMVEILNQMPSGVATFGASIGYAEANTAVVGADDGRFTGDQVAELLQEPQTAMFIEYNDFTLVRDEQGKVKAKAFYEFGHEVLSRDVPGIATVNMIYSGNSAVDEKLILLEVYVPHVYDFAASDPDGAKTLLAALRRYAQQCE